MASVIANRHKTAASDRRCVLGFAHALFVAAAWGRFGARLRVRGTGCRRGAQRAAGPRRFADGLEPPIALLAESAPGPPRQPAGAKRLRRWPAWPARCFWPVPSASANSRTGFWKATRRELPDGARRCAAAPGSRPLSAARSAIVHDRHRRCCIARCGACQRRGMPC